jgi:hypothetical protein
MALYLRTKFHEILPSGSKVISGGRTDRQTGDLISLLSFFESILNICPDLSLPHVRGWLRTVSPSPIITNRSA